MTIQYLKQNNLIIQECISGSKAYGLDTSSSDTDIKGVFLMPKKDYFGLNYVPQVSDSTNDTVYYELGRYMELLSLNNPNILELLNTPAASTLYKHPYLEAIIPKMILSKRCKDTFGKFALSQIKKAKGLKKKIVNPMSKERKGILSFCFVNYQRGSIPLLRFLELKGWKQEDCGLINIANMRNVFGLYHNPKLNYKGIIKDDTSNEIRLSSVPKEEAQEALLYFNLEGYSLYCKEYKAYWEWVGNRNESRYQTTKSHGKKYDSKNMMHTFRLLEMAIEIGKYQKINIVRPNRSFLLDVKSGKYEYSELLEMAQKLQNEMDAAFETSDLPETPNLDYINALTAELRAKFYALKKFE